MVTGTMEFMTFHILGIIIPTDELIFFRGVETIGNILWLKPPKWRCLAMKASAGLEFITGWWFQTWLLFSISYMGCHPSHWRTSSFFQDGYCTTNQITCWRMLRFDHKSGFLWSQTVNCKLRCATHNIPTTMALYQTHQTGCLIETGAILSWKT